MIFRGDSMAAQWPRNGRLRGNRGVAPVRRDADRARQPLNAVPGASAVTVAVRPITKFSFALAQNDCLNFDLLFEMRGARCS
jgi:hypothetical protein